MEYKIERTPVFRYLFVRFPSNSIPTDLLKSIDRETRTGVYFNIGSVHSK